MFSKTITLSSTDGSVLLHVTADTGGLKSLTIEQPPAPPKPVTPQILMDYIQEAVKTPPSS